MAIKMIKLVFNCFAFMTLLNAADGMRATTMRKMDIASSMETPPPAGDNMMALPIYSDINDEYFERNVGIIEKEICAMDIKELCFIKYPSIAVFKRKTHLHENRYITYDDDFCDIKSLLCKRKLKQHRKKHAKKSRASKVPKVPKASKVPKVAQVPREAHDGKEADQDVFSEEFVMYENLPDRQHIVIFEHFESS